MGRTDAERRAERTLRHTQESRLCVGDAARHTRRAVHGQNEVAEHGQQLLAVGIHRSGHVREESAAKDVADGYGRCQSAQQGGT